jgi:hypothetical protein
MSELQTFIEGLGGYDLHETLLGTMTVPDWSGFPIQHFSYLKIDPNGVQKTGEVALLDPSPEQLAEWISTAVRNAVGWFDISKAKVLAQHCLDQSGFQFPVRGIHWENMTPIFTAYTFFDGVTVRLKGWNPSWPTTPLSQEMLDEAVNASWSDLSEARLYARLQGTTREEYKANGGKLPTDGKDWLNAVRDCYQRAWGTSENELMTAKAKALF